MAGSAELLAFADGPEHDGHRVRWFAGPDEGPSQADAGRDDAGVPGRELAAPLGQHPLVPVNGLADVPGRQVGGGQLSGDEEGVWVARHQLGVAAGGQVPPVFDGRPDQAGAVEAPACLQQQRMASVGPQHVGGRVLQAGRVHPQAVGHPRLRLIGGPCLQQRIGGRSRRGVLDLRGRRQPDRRLEHRAHHDRRRRDGPVDADQAGSLDGEQRVPGRLRVDRRREWGHGPAQVRDHGRRAEDGSRNPVTIEQGHEDEHEPYRRTGQQRFRLPQ